MKLTKKQNEVLEEIAYDFIYKRDGHGFIKRAPEGGAWHKASITVKSLLLVFPSPMLADLPTESGRIYLTSMGWTAFFDEATEYPPAGSEAARLTALADQRVEFVLRMLSDEDGDDAGVAGEASHRHINVR